MIYSQVKTCNMQTTEYSMILFWGDYIYFLKIFICSFLGRGREEEREGEKRQCVVASHAPPSGDLAHESRHMP